LAILTRRKKCILGTGLVVLTNCKSMLCDGIRWCD